MKKDKLLPCPFCGGEATRSIEKNADYIECVDCCATAELGMWNKRKKPYRRFIDHINK